MALSEAPRIRLIEAVAFERPVRFRMPFRFGAARVDGTSQAFVRVRIADEQGRVASGWSAEMMMPKWFDKNPELTAAENIDQLRTALRLGIEALMAAGTGTTFGLHASVESAHHQACAEAGLNGLIASFGLALADRAVVDALCRLEGVGAIAALRANRFGITAATAPDLAGFDLDGFLSAVPAAPRIAARHTVGLGDALATSEIERPLNDGMPESLEQVIAAYGHTYFKLKVSGRPEADALRLARIAAVLDAQAGDYRITLDGNEQFESVEAVLELLDRIVADAKLQSFRARVLFLEQPIPRALALGTPAYEVAKRIALEIDESDADIGAFITAQSLGYTGISSKSCKGFYRALLNAARVAGGDGLFMSAEDLTTQAGIGLQQDLMLASAVGATHVERNGHHYVDGMGDTPTAEQTAFLSAHGDLYRDVSGRARLRIDNGELNLSSVLEAPGLGSSVEPDWSAMVPLGETR